MFVYQMLLTKEKEKRIKTVRKQKIKGHYH